MSLGSATYSTSWPGDTAISSGIRPASITEEEIALNFQKKGPAGRRLQGAWHKLQITNLSFSYQNKQEGELHLDNISFSIQHGQKIALIGESGSGKTTFLKLIRALYKPRHAEVSLDGKGVPLGLDGISEDVTLLPQEPELFNTTIRNNITLGSAILIVWSRDIRIWLCSQK